SEAYRQHRASIDRTVELANADNDKVLAEASRQETLMLALSWTVGGLVLFLVIGAAAGVVLAILSPINRIIEAARVLTAGRVDVTIPYADRKDEIGEMARAVDVFRANAVERERLEVAMMRTREKEIERQQNLDRHLLAFKNTITSN